MPKKDYVDLNGERHVVMQCGSCAVWHTIPEVVYENCYREGGFWHCPNGHSRGWKEGADKREIDEMRRERDRLKQDAARLEEERAAAAARAEKAELAHKRLKRRSAAGTCPCCQRTFTNMAEHMRQQHPGYLKETGIKVVPLQREVKTAF